MSKYFPPRWPFLSDRWFAFFKNPQMIYAGYVNVVTGKSQTGRVKLNISASAGEVKFSLGKGKKIHQVGFHWVCYGGTRQLIALCVPRVLTYVLLCNFIPFSGEGHFRMRIFFFVSANIKKIILG